MTNVPFTVFWLVALFLSQMNTVSDKKAGRDPKTQELIERIQQGDDPKALLEAGRTGNLVFVPYLREKLRHNVHKHESLNWEAQMALAKLNQRDQLQAIYCQVATGNETQVADTIDECDYVGGWFSVKILNAVISGELAANPAIDQHAPPDAQRMKPIYLAAGTLAALIPDAAHLIESQKSFSLFSSESFSFWTNYIRTHEEELKRLQPTGEGVDLSPSACKKGKPRKKH
jgi:hypothetical protein